MTFSVNCPFCSVDHRGHACLYSAVRALLSTVLQQLTNSVKPNASAVFIHYILLHVLFLDALCTKHSLIPNYWTDAN